MAQQPQKKMKRFAQKKGGPTIAQSARKKRPVPVSRANLQKTQENTPPPATPAPPPAPVAVPPPPPVPASTETPQPVTPPVAQAEAPAPSAAPSDVPKASVAPQPVPAPQAPAEQPKSPPVPVTPPFPVQGQKIDESINISTQSQNKAPVHGKRTGSHNKTVQKQVYQGKPAIQTEAEDLKDEVASYLEVCDSCLEKDNSPKDIVDVVHMLVRSLNLDVVTIAILDEKKKNLIDSIASRGYSTPPNKSVVKAWEKSIIKGEGIDWKNLMRVAGDNQTELAYWIVHESLDSIGYVPIRDNKSIYGFLFVAANEKKRQSPLTSFLLDACGSRIGFSCALKHNKADWPETVLNLSCDIRNQLSLLMGYTEMLKEAGFQAENFNSIIENCNKTIIKTTQMLDSMTSEAAGGC